MVWRLLTFVVSPLRMHYIGFSSGRATIATYLITIERVQAWTISIFATLRVLTPPKYIAPCSLSAEAILGKKCDPLVFHTPLCRSNMLLLGEIVTLSPYKNGRGSRCKESSPKTNPPGSSERRWTSVLLRCLSAMHIHLPILFEQHQRTPANCCSIQNSNLA